MPDAIAGIVRDNVRKNDERNPRHVRGSDDKGSQRDVFCIFCYKLARFSRAAKSQTFSQNESTVELVDVKDSL